MNKPPLTIQSEAYDVLLRYHWPGNVRQLQNVIERAVVLAQGSMITPRNLPHEVVHSTPLDPNVVGDAPYPHPAVDGVPLRSPVTETQSLNLAQREKAALVAALDQCNGNKKKAAELLGIHRPTLYTKLKKFGLAV
jgi:transcriptional regulator of acetoin/glycerol metabolism